MPPHTSHILQPLDVGCFAPLKPALTLVFNQAFSKDNILSSFRATSLVLDNLEVVLSRLEVKPRTPTPPLPRTN
ncbi:uncharacterized protein M421DRAFT_420989 [Didymella exigua CBS 183.55]|uniref:DDE-1 domain-containing protein n=1 Tax=Didymella exigua CBS 183.55 TaxID=1150837 RepID=A0A6A5RN54_9PLEO|nr:uncharacterized protein M421DRAFT_420989 [Didymella exigua CBS 183.55]KAF1928444.1 hypothetical protein M421DRAFT_420989 [Didymella exigua CBS 183.55]